MIDRQSGGSAGIQRGTNASVIPNSIEHNGIHATDFLPEGSNRSITTRERGAGALNAERNSVASNSESVNEALKVHDCVRSWIVLIAVRVGVSERVIHILRSEAIHEANEVVDVENWRRR